MASPGGGDGIDDGRLFEDVRFVLVGFDDDVESQYRSDMVQRGGVDAGRLSNGCTHVIVWGLVYDDPQCVVAREQGKKVVTELWVDDSLDRGVLADADRVIYWPVRDLNGIPGAESLQICLTGYEKKYREDITKMVSLMGAQFSRPLLGNVVTHLVCYKFEGEKYEVARRVHIKLVNHRWLEDCLKTWKILPVDDYSKSTWELELMEAQAKDSEDEAEDTCQRSFNSRSRVRRTPNMKKCAETSVNADANAPLRSHITPNGNREVVAERHLNMPGHIRETEDADSKTDDITAQGGSESSMLATSAMADGSAPIDTLPVLSVQRENAAVRNTNSPKPVQESEEKYVGARTPDNTNGAPGTPNWSANKLYSFKVHRGQHQEKDGLSGNLVPAVPRSNIDNKLINEETDPNSEGGSRSTNISNPSNSRKASQRSLASEQHSVHLAASHQKTESISNSRKASQKSLASEQHSVHLAASHQKTESMLRADSNNYSSERGQQNIVEYANIKGAICNEKNRNVERLDGAYAQQRKNLNSPTTLKLQKEYLEPETSPCPFMSRLSDVSETENVSSVGTNRAEDVAVDLAQQQSSLSTSRQSRARKTSLKNAVPVNGGELAEYSSCGKKVKSRLKPSVPLKATTNHKCTTSPSVTVQDEKASSGLSVDNMGGKDAEASASAVNQDLLHLIRETGNAHVKDLAHDISVHSSRNSQVVSCSRFAATRVTALDANVKDNEELAALNFKLEKISSDANVKESAKRFRDTSSNVQDEASHSEKFSVPTERSAGPKRPRSASMEIDGSVVNTGKEPVSESRPAEVIPHNDAGAASKNGWDNSSAAKLKAVSPEKVPISVVSNTFARRTRNALTRMDDARITSNLDDISQENTGNTNKVSDFVNADGNKNNLPKELPNTRVRKTVAKKSQKSVTNMSSEALVDKTETKAAGSLFDDLFPEDNVEGCPKVLSSSATASDCGTLSPKNVSNPTVRNAVGKRKMKAVEHKTDSKCSKLGSAIVSVAKEVSSKRIKEMSCNINNINADEDFVEANKDGLKDVSGLFCQDSAAIDKQGVLSPKLRSRKYNKAVTSDHEKENRQEHSNLNSKADAKTSSLCSRSNAKSMQEGTDMPSKCQSVKGKESKTVIMSEPVQFILSGNRQQRRDYRSILRRLKGRVCRDSHHWSYQATHFIAPEPLRRTEKFFAAAAAGRWILKSDYLTSCIEAGKFLDEEPFEWFGTGLSDGEKISLEAPRKWRILRQQMHHGAFYGMKFIIYGQLILPTLDTLKRAVRAGDGTILATSPPYTRILDSGVDFAVVSESIPSADAWVQEFIRHGIPCVSADYLVEYVSKPGHPLDTYVLFKTNDLASKSLEKLMKNQQEVATDEAEQSEDDDRDDLSCSVCGHSDRGEVMLICGDEKGTVGCGIGMHMDCCDPPLDAVPDDDWLCPKCQVPKPNSNCQVPKPKTNCQVPKPKMNCQVPKPKTKPTRSTGRKLRPSKEM